MKILPSLLAADVGNLEAGCRLAQTSGGDALHLDIMDGHFVPNISMGPVVVEMAKRCVNIPLSVHLMLTRPDQYLKRFIDAGADTLLIHIESECDVPAALVRIREMGAKPGITLNPETPAELVYPVLQYVDEVLCMSVRPGYGGQAFMPEVLPKIRDIRIQANLNGKTDMSIMVDGGIDLETVIPVASHGADAFVAGTSLYAASDMSQAIIEMRNRASAAWMSAHGSEGTA